MNTPTSCTQMLKAAFEVGNYEGVIMACQDATPQDTEGWRLLGLAQLRTGLLEAAESPLTRAAVLGDQEASVELGNLFRLAGRFEEAVQHLESTWPALTGELALRALRWWGVAEFQQGQTVQGLKRCERAWYGYLAFGNDELSARVTQNLAEMHRRMGDDGRAKQLFQEAARVLSDGPIPFPKLTTLQGLANTQLQLREFEAARLTIQEAFRVLGDLEAPRWLAMNLCLEAELNRLTGQQGEYNRTLHRLRDLTADLDDFELKVWVASRLAEQYSLLGLHAQAMEAVHALGRPGEPLPTALRAVRGIVMRRRGQHHLAQEDLSQALDEARGGADPHLVTRILLHLADTQRQSGDLPGAATLLREALERILQDRDKARYNADLDELAELTQNALLEPDLAPYMEAVLDQIALLCGTARLPEERLTHLQVLTLGRVQVVRDGAPIALTLQGSAPLLAYLALNPGRTRQEIQLALYPDKEPITGANYVRAVFRELRERVGRDVIAYSGPHNQPKYALGRNVSLTLDLRECLDAVDRSDLARALALYRGPFLAGVDDSDWVEQTRDQVRTALGLELRTQLDAARDKGDLRRALLLANQYLKLDPYDPEVLEERVELARSIVPPQELARYLVELQRVLN